MKKRLFVLKGLKELV